MHKSLALEKGLKVLESQLAKRKKAEENKDNESTPGGWLYIVFFMTPLPRSFKSTNFYKMLMVRPLAVLFDIICITNFSINF